jgi:hypothetical protein
MMANPDRHKVPLVGLRNIDPELWEAFGDVAKPDRSAILKEFIRWYIRERGAKLPRRPDAATTHP